MPYAVLISLMAFRCPSVPAVVFSNAENNVRRCCRSVARMALKSVMLSFNLFWAWSAPKSPCTQLMISFPYTDSNVIPTTSAVCQLTIEVSTCFHTGMAICPDFFSRSYSTRAVRILSAKMGRLLEMAKKNMLAPMVSDGNSRATCCTDIDRPLNPVPAERL